MPAYDPILASSTPALMEVGGDCALYVEDTADSAAFAAVLEKAIGDAALRQSLTRKARTRAHTFTWDRCASGVAAVVRELVS